MCLTYSRYQARHSIPCVLQPVSGKTRHSMCLTYSRYQARHGIPCVLLTAGIRQDRAFRVSYLQPVSGKTRHSVCLTYSRYQARHGIPCVLLTAGIRQDKALHVSWQDKALHVSYFQPVSGKTRHSMCLTYSRYQARHGIPNKVAL
jgi:uncharacterized protein (DUF2237 family)